MSYLSLIYMPFKSDFERNPLCILHKRHRLENWESSNRLFGWLNNQWLVYAWECLYTDGKWSTQRMYDFGFSCRFVLVRVWYLSSSEAYTNNWGLFGKENYLTFDWWKHFFKILRRSEVTINLTRRLKKMEASEFAPL
jgi:hypothetical protein